MSQSTANILYGRPIYRNGAPRSNPIGQAAITMPGFTMEEVEGALIPWTYSGWGGHGGIVEPCTGFNLAAGNVAYSPVHPWHTAAKLSPALVAATRAVAGRGCTVIEAKQKDAECAVALWFWADRGEYVIAHVALNCRPGAGWFWGHYFRTEDEARRSGRI